MQKHSITLEWIGTHRELCFFCEFKLLGAIEFNLKELLASFEQRFSRFRSDSLFNAYNRWEISWDDDEDLSAMLRIWRLYELITKGYFSLHVKTQLENLWYGKKQEIGIHEVDLWGIGKWYLIHLMKQLMLKYWVDRYLINGWWDIAISQTSLDDFGPIALEHPSEANQYFWTLELLSWGMAWSGPKYRNWKWEDGVRQHHLIDPITGKPAQNGLLSVHVLHSDIIVADILATAFFVLPMEDIDGVAAMCGAEYCLVWKDLNLLKSEWFQIITTFS